MRLQALLLCLALTGQARADWSLPSIPELLSQLRSSPGPTAAPRPAAARPPRRAPAPKLLPVPLHQQETDYSCGAASLLSVLRYWQAFGGAERDLYDALQTTTDGTEPDKIEEVARKFGLSAQLREGMSLDDLRAALARGDTAILDIQAWREGPSAKLPWEDVWEDGHYVVLIGMDDSRAYFEDPVLDDSYAAMALDELPRRWHDYENRSGAVRRYFQAAVVISGKTPLANPSLPAKKPVRLP